MKLYVNSTTNTSERFLSFIDDNDTGRHQIELEQIELESITNSNTIIYGKSRVYLIDELGVQKLDLYDQFEKRAFKPCPFCQSTHVEESMYYDSDGNRYYRMVCNSCMTEGPKSESLIDAFSVWNKSVS